jgi:hypothetical protein
MSARFFLLADLSFPLVQASTVLLRWVHLYLNAWVQHALRHAIGIQGRKHSYKYFAEEKILHRPTLGILCPAPVFSHYLTCI